jgi:hypothetical protein
MFRFACVFILFGALAVSAPAAPPEPVVFEGHIKDVFGTDGTLTLTLRQGNRDTDRDFLIGEAKIKGLYGDEMKVGDLRRGDRVQLEMTADGRIVRVIRLLRPLHAK